MFAGILHWLGQHQALVAWMGGISLAMFIASLMMLPWLVSLIPADYFAHDARVAAKWKQAHPIIRITVLILKNLVGFIILMAGLAMLVLPGQGLLSILVALMLMDYPGKFRFERWIISRPTLLHLINRLRARFGKPDLVVLD